MFTDSKPIIDQGSSPAGETGRPRRVTRQFRVTHTATGIVTYVNGPVWLCRSGKWGWHGVGISSKAGLRYPKDCTVSVVPRGEEIPLPFDDCPLVIRRQPEPAA